MEKTIKIRSSFLSVLNEALQKLKINDTVKDFTPVIVEADGKFTSVVKTENEFDPSVFGANIDTEEDESENDTQRKETREQLLNKAKDAMKQTISSSSELKDILKKIEELSKSDDDKWQLNKEHNTASLPARNAYIFKQNNNLCLSHKGKIELFKSVQELRKWLKDNNYPLPDDSIVIHESVDIKEHTKGDAGSSDYFGKHGNNGRNWVDLYYQYKERDRQDQENNINNKKSDILSDKKFKNNAKIIKDFEEIQRQALARKNALVAKVEQLDKEYLAVAKNVWARYVDNDLNKDIRTAKKAELTAAKQELEDYCNNDPIYKKYLTFLGKDGYVKGKVANAYSANKAHVQAFIRQIRDDKVDLSKRVPDEVYKADMHKKDEPVVSDKYLNFDDEMDECCGGIGGGITSVANLGPFVQHVANKVKKKKEEEKEALEEALNEDFPDFAPQAADDVNAPSRGQAGKKAEAFINSLIENPETIKKLKNGEFKELPFTKKDYLNVLQSLYYKYSGTHVGNSNWPKKVKQVLKTEASDLLSKFENQELDPIENDIVSTFIQIYQESGAEMTNEGLIDGLALALDDIFRKNEPQFATFNQQLANKLTSYLNQDFGEIKVEIKPGDTLLYGKTAVEQDDINNTANKQILYKLNKHISKGEDSEEVGNLDTRKQWNIENFKTYMQKKNISNVLKGLYDAIYSPDSKAKFADTNDTGVSKWLEKNKENMISLLTDDEINQIKSNWEQKKAEIQQEEPISEPAPQEVKAEVQQDNELSDNEKKALNMLMTMNPNLDISKLTIAQLKEKINKAMALFGESKQESIYESAMKHPWLKKIMGQRLVEDDSPADFATGSPISSDMDSAAASADTSTTTDTSATPDIDLGGGAPATPNGFGDVDISVNGYDPEGEGEDGAAPVPNAPEYKIVDVLANQDDPTDIRVKLQNTETGEIEIKELSEM